MIFINHLIIILALLSTFVQAICPSHHATVESAQAVLTSNWVSSMNSTLPSPNLYPHQWSWDSAFIAIGYSHYDTQKAVDEMKALFKAQWKNGLVPHIVFNPNADESYFPGSAFWNIQSSPESPDFSITSGIVQPPVHAIASLSVYQNAQGPHMKQVATHYLEHIYPKLKLWHHYLYNERDPNDEGLVFIRHMWESGMDNSPAWDLALERIDLTHVELPQYKRVDKAKVGDHNERPTSFFYDRAVYLIKLFYENSYDEAAIFKTSPFLVQDVLFNSILARAGHALAQIAHILGLEEDAKIHMANSERTAAAITNKLYHPEEKFFLNYDMVADALIPAKISGGFGAVYGANLTPQIVAHLVAHLYSSDFLGPDLSAWTIPSVARSDPGYTNSTYWKGPAWLNINYLVRDGLVRNGEDNADAQLIAAYLKDRSIELMNKVGFYEYFNPISGSPHGAHHFSWSAALTIDWICTQEIRTWLEVVVSAFESQASIVVTLVIGLFVIIGMRLFFSVTSTQKDTEGVNVELDAQTGKKSSLKEAQAQMALPRARARALPAHGRIARRTP